MQISLRGNIKVVVKKTLHRHELGGDLVQLVHKGVLLIAVYTRSPRYRKKSAPFIGINMDKARLINITGKCIDLYVFCFFTVVTPSQRLFRDRKTIDKLQTKCFMCVCVCIYI